MSFLLAATLTLHAITVQFAAVDASAGTETQYCGNSRYYCKVSGQCMERSERCVGRGNCLNLGIEEGCSCDGSYAHCNVYLGKTTLSLSSSSKKKRRNENTCTGFLFGNAKIEHQFILYRGFVWEFGKSYLVQILDINDPNYKYNRPSERKGIKSITLQGRSSCTYEQALPFLNNFELRYRLCTNNCQHFAKGLLTWLLNDCSYRGKRLTNETQLSEHFAMISHEPCPTSSTHDRGIASYNSCIAIYIYM